MSRHHTRESVTGARLKKGASHEETVVHAVHECPESTEVWAAIARTWEATTSEPLDTSSPVLTVLGLRPRPSADAPTQARERFEAMLVRLESGGSRHLALLAMHELVAASWKRLARPRPEHLVSKIVASGQHASSKRGGPGPSSP